MGTTLAAIGVLTLAASTLAENRSMGECNQRGLALTAATQFVPFLESDESWADLYSRLRTLRDKAEETGGTESRLVDGRKTWTPQAYCPTYVSPPGLDDFRVLVDVPAAPLDPNPTGPAFLREDVTSDAFGLPADLNGDGVVDGDPRDDDYFALPIVVFIRWNVNGSSREMRFHTWLRGDR